MLLLCFCVACAGLSHSAEASGYELAQLAFSVLASYVMKVIKGNW